MDKNQLDVKTILEEIFREILEIPETEEVTNLQMLETEKWDSLAQVLIVSAIETHFGLRISAKDLATITSFKSATLSLTELLSRD